MSKTKLNKPVITEQPDAMRLDLTMTVMPIALGEQDKWTGRLSADVFHPNGSMQCYGQLYVYQNYASKRAAVDHLAEVAKSLVFVPGKLPVLRRPEPSVKSAAREEPRKDTWYAVLILEHGLLRPATESDATSATYFAPFVAKSTGLALSTDGVGFITYRGKSVWVPLRYRLSTRLEADKRMLSLMTLYRDELRLIANQTSKLSKRSTVKASQAEAQVERLEGRIMASELNAKLSAAAKSAAKDKTKKVRK